MKLKLDSEKLLRNLEEDIADAAMTVSYTIGKVRGKEIQINVTSNPGDFLGKFDRFHTLICVSEEPVEE